MNARPSSEEEDVIGSVRTVQNEHRVSLREKRTDHVILHEIVHDVLKGSKMGSIHTETVEEKDCASENAARGIQKKPPRNAGMK